MKHNILIVEDNKILSWNIQKYLELEWIKSTQVFSWEKAIYEIVSWDFDAIILDIWLPNKDGLTICSEIREKGYNIPILMLTARVTTKDKITGFKSWADDYLTKPFDYEELLVRLMALIRRNYSQKSDDIKIWNIEIILDQKSVLLKNKEIKLSKTEYELLLYLAQNNWKTLSKESIYKKVWWEYDEFENSRKVDVYIWYLRKKLWKDTIQTKRWEWYILLSPL